MTVAVRPTPLLEAHNISKRYRVRGRLGGTIQAVDDVSFAVDRGETLALVGESGCGKSTTARLILKLEPATAGTVTYEGRDITNLAGEELRKLRREMQIVFQDPYSSINPRMRVRDVLGEPFRIHGLGGGDVAGRVAQLLDLVGLSSDSGRKFPHEFSGGQRQRIVIARAIALRPSLVVCDEPVSALDVSVQSQIINLFRDLQTELQLTYVFISHDLSVVRHVSNRVAVMYLGSLVELGPKQDVFAAPLHPYTQALMSAIPVAQPSVQRSRKRVMLRGDVPSLLNKPAACSFHTRCPFAVERCRTEVPLWREVRPSHFVACHLAPLPTTSEVAVEPGITA